MTNPIACGAILLALAPASALAQTSAIHRQPLQTAEFPGNGLHTAVIRTTVDAGGLIARHTHPGIEIAYVEAGEVLVSIDGTAPFAVRAGGSWQVPPHTAHSVRNTGKGPAVVISTYVVDATAPLATPAP